MLHSSKECQRMVVRAGAAGLPAPAPRDAPRSELHFLGRGGGRLHVSTEHSSTAQRSGTTLSTGSSDAPLLRGQWHHPALLRPLLRRLYRRCHRLMLPDLPHLLAAGGMRRRAAGQGSGGGAARRGEGGCSGADGRRGHVPEGTGSACAERGARRCAVRRRVGRHGQRGRALGLDGPLRRW